MLVKGASSAHSVVRFLTDGQGQTSTPFNSLPTQWYHMVTKVLVNYGADKGLLPDQAIT